MVYTKVIALSVLDLKPFIFLLFYFILSNHLLFIWFQVGPLRCWPGGLCLSRSIGDMDVGEFIVPVPHVKQVKVTSHFVLVDWSMLCFHSCVYCIAW